MAKTVLPLTVFMMHFSVAAAVALRHNEFVQLDSRRRRGTGTAFASSIAADARAWRMSAPNSAKSLQPSLKSERLSLRRTVSLTPIPSSGQSSKAGSEPGTVPAGISASRGRGNFVRQISLGWVALDRVMAADELERADEATVARAIAQAASAPALAVAKELQ